MSVKKIRQISALCGKDIHMIDLIWQKFHTNRFYSLKLKIFSFLKVFETLISDPHICILDLLLYTFGKL